MGNHLKDLKKTESGINKNLYFICIGVTLLTMLMVLTEFFVCGFFSEVRIEFFYLSVLVIYSLHKEFVRWLGNKKVERQGECFVYAWIGLTALLYLIYFLRGVNPDDSTGCQSLGALREATIISIEVLIVFISTRFLKFLKIFFKK